MDFVLSNALRTTLAGSLMRFTSMSSRGYLTNTTCILLGPLRRMILIAGATGVGYSAATFSSLFC